jgi:hypothetical protein
MLSEGGITSRRVYSSFRMADIALECSWKGLRQSKPKEFDQFVRILTVKAAADQDALEDNFIYGANVLRFSQPRTHFQTLRIQRGTGIGT